MAFTATYASIPLCDRSSTHHQVGGKKFSCSPLPHRACFPQRPQSNHTIAQPTMRTRATSFPLEPSFPNQGCIHDRSITFTDEPPQQKSWIVDRTPRKTPAPCPELAVAQKTPERLKVKRLKDDENLSSWPLSSPDHATAGVNSSPSSRKWSTGQVNLETPWRTPYERGNAFRNAKYGKPPILVESLTKPLPANPSSICPSTPRDGILPGKDIEMQPSPPSYSVTRTSTHHKVRRSTKPPTPLKLFPPSPTNSLDSCYTAVASSPTSSVRKSFYLQPQTSVFEDDDEKVGLMDYFKWPLHGSHKADHDYWHGKTIRKRSRSLSWKGLLCLPCQDMI